MPGFDRTGPEGKGSRTGRAMGKCKPTNQNANTDVSEESFPGGRGRGTGRGIGRGFGKGRGMGRSRS
ncbi:hypothetical protein ES705_45132 [subsurface metagenome]